MSIRLNELSKFGLAMITLAVCVMLPEFALAADPKPLVEGSNKILELFKGKIAMSATAIVIAIMGVMMWRGFIEGTRVVFTLLGITLVFGSQLFAKWYVG